MRLRRKRHDCAFDALSLETKMNSTFQHFQKHNFIMSIWAFIAAGLFFIEPLNPSLFYILLAIWFAGFFGFLIVSKSRVSDAVDVEKDETLKQILAKSRSVFFFLGVGLGAFLTLILKVLYPELDVPVMLLWSVILFTLAVGNLGIVLGMKAMFRLSLDPQRL